MAALLAAAPLAAQTAGQPLPKWTPGTLDIHQINTGRGLIRDFAMLLSNNANTGGTCFGDSGGPNFLAGTLTIAGVTSFGTNWACGGTGGVYRLDREDDLDWLETEFGDLF